MTKTGPIAVSRVQTRTLLSASGGGVTFTSGLSHFYVPKSMAKVNPKYKDLFREGRKGGVFLLKGTTNSFLSRIAIVMVSVSQDQDRNPLSPFP